MNEALEFKASYDWLTKTISVAVIILFAAISYSSIMAIFNSKGNAKAIFIHSGVLLLLSGILIIAYIFSPRKYLINSENIIIKRLFGDVVLPVKQIRNIRLLEDQEMSGTIRTFGNGGLFGYYGKFYNSTLDSFTMYATQRTNRICLEMTNGEKVIITPDNISIIGLVKKRIDS